MSSSELSDPEILRTKLQSLLSPSNSPLSNDPLLNPTIIFAMAAGSKAFNLSVEGSDTDYFGVYRAPLDQFLSPVNRPKKHITLTDPDIIIYEASTFCSLILKGNPKLIEPLFTSHLCYCSEEFHELQKEGKKLLSIGVIRQYISYSKSQLWDVYKNKGNKFKKYYHCLRLLSEALRILKGDQPAVWLEGEERDFLMSVRKGLIGEMPLLQKIFQQLATAEQILHSIHPTSQTNPYKTKEAENLENTEIQLEILQILNSPFNPKNLNQNDHQEQDTTHGSDLQQRVQHLTCRDEGRIDVMNQWLKSLYSSRSYSDYLSLSFPSFLSLESHSSFEEKARNWFSSPQDTDPKIRNQGYLKAKDLLDKYQISGTIVFCSPSGHTLHSNNQTVHEAHVDYVGIFQANIDNSFRLDQRLIRVSSDVGPEYDSLLSSESSPGNNNNDPQNQKLANGDTYRNKVILWELNYATSLIFSGNHRIIEALFNVPTNRDDGVRGDESFGYFSRSWVELSHYKWELISKRYFHHCLGLAKAQLQKFKYQKNLIKHSKSLYHAYRFIKQIRYVLSTIDNGESSSGKVDSTSSRKKQPKKQESNNSDWSKALDSVNFFVTDPKIEKLYSIAKHLEDQDKSGNENQPPTSEIISYGPELDLFVEEIEKELNGIEKEIALSPVFKGPNNDVIHRWILASQIFALAAQNS